MGSSPLCRGRLYSVDNRMISSPELSVVIPAFDERDNIVPLLAEIAATLRGRMTFEIIYVDDASRDDSLAVLQSEFPRYPELRVIRHRQHSGQSAALRSGIKAAQAAWIATLDGDRQNDPADIILLLAARSRFPDSVKLFAGWRVKRRDNVSKRWASRIANAIRSQLLRDQTPDTGCGIKLFERAAWLELPWFDHMHRYLPALIKRAGFESVSVPVNHRERKSGVSKYNNLGRAWVGLADLRGVAWLIRRNQRPDIEELPRP